MDAPSADWVTLDDRDAATELGRGDRRRPDRCQ
jgi:hypothetical protein